MSVGGGGGRPVRMCVRCDRVTSTPVLVSEVHAASGPGFNVYACAECAPSFPGPPDVFDLLEDGRRGCGQLGRPYLWIEHFEPEGVTDRFVRGE